MPGQGAESTAQGALDDPAGRGKNETNTKRRPGQGGVPSTPPPYRASLSSRIWGLEGGER